MAMCNSLRANALGKGMNQLSLQLRVDSRADALTRCIPLNKITLVSNHARGGGVG